MCTIDREFSTYRGLCADGWSRTAIDHALAEGSLTRVRRGIYATDEACDEATAAARHGGTLHCLSAARHEGLWVLADGADLHVGVRAGDHQYPHEEDCRCVIHWDKRQTMDAFGLPSIPRILRQILRCCGTEEFFVALESAMRLRRVTRKGLTWLRSHTNKAGREALRLARWDADSGLESLVRWRLRRYRLVVRTQVFIANVGRVDLLIGEHLIVEVDGRENHDGANLRHKDLLRDARAAAQGYLTLRFDYALVVHDWPLVERAILAQLAAGRHL
ncbi:DUF559 domain-containing protein [Microbacterium sp. P05]|uniref:DUF559 domain-containing protein n=1 Tax=Microbacterium sp. P05 TaxID=3366948 RepID=UPI0037453B36